MHAWEAIQQAIDYIETHTSEEISIEQLANIAGLSPYYFQRLFKRLTKRTVFEYIKLRRLAQATEALKDNRRILDVALEYGFSSHANFTRMFKESYGITPEEYRSNMIPLNQMNKPDLQLTYTLIDEDVPLITEGIIMEITRKKLNKSELYYGLSAQIPIAEQIPVGEATGIDNPYLLWEQFHKEKNKINNHTTEEIELGSSSFGNSDNGTFTYFVGVLVNDSSPLPEGFVSWELPVNEYIVCSIDAENHTDLVTSALDKAMNYLFSTWLPNHNMMTQPFSAEKYYKDTKEGAHMEIWVIPVAIESNK